jgi:hypothetical protein
MDSKKMSNQEIDNLKMMISKYTEPISGEVDINETPLMLNLTSRDGAGQVIERGILYYYNVIIRSNKKEFSFSETIDQPLSSIAWLIAYNIWSDLDGEDKKNIAEVIFDKDIILSMSQYD